jgi:hypothetical protein
LSTLSLLDYEYIFTSFYSGLGGGFDIAIILEKMTGGGVSQKMAGLNYVFWGGRVMAGTVPYNYIH